MFLARPSAGVVSRILFALLHLISSFGRSAVENKSIRCTRTSLGQTGTSTLLYFLWTKDVIYACFVFRVHIVNLQLHADKYMFLLAFGGSSCRWILGDPGGDPRGILGGSWSNLGDPGRQAPFKTNENWGILSDRLKPL